MSHAAATERALPLNYEPVGDVPPYGVLLRQLRILAVPVLVQFVLDLLVGINDTYLANKLKIAEHRAPAGSAVGTITYFLWFFNLLVSSVGAGTTAIIARAKGARHRSLANSVTGQSMTAAIFMGLGVGAILYVFATPVIRLTGLPGEAPKFALPYLRMLTVTLPFTMAMFIASACQRGYGDTATAALVMIAVDIVNFVFSWALCRGWFGLPEMGFNGIALGTVIAYVFGGVTQFIVLFSGRNGLRLFWHRMWPPWVTIKRLVRMGFPAGMEGILMWLANFGV